MRMLPIFLAALAMLSGLAAAATYTDVCSISSFDYGSGAIQFIAEAFMIVSLAIALAYMYSRVREDAASGVWAKDEAYNLVISVLLFAGLLAFFQASCSVAQSYAGLNPFDSAVNYLDWAMNSNGMDVLRTLTYNSLGDQLRGTQYWYFGMAPFSGAGAAEYANYRALSAHKEFLIDLYIPMLASLNAQKQLLLAAEWAGVSLMLPFAFVMRLIPPTRDFGNTLIAIFFTIYVVVPLLYTMSGQAFRQIVASPGCIDCSAHNFYSYGIDGGNGEDGGAYSGAVMGNAMLFRIGSTIPQAVFLPNLVLVVGVTCVMSLSKGLRAIAV